MAAPHAWLGGLADRPADVGTGRLTGVRRYLVGDRVRARRDLAEANVISALVYCGANIMQGQRGRVILVGLGFQMRDVVPWWQWFQDVYEVRFDTVDMPVPGLTNRDLEPDDSPSGLPGW